MKKTLLVAVAAVALPGAALAQDIGAFPGVYIGAGGGLTWALNNGSAGVTTYTGYAFGGKLGYDFVGPRAELEVSYGRIPSNAFVPGTVLNGGGGQLNVMANGYYDFFPNATITPYIGAGVGVAFVDSNTSLGSTQFAYQGMLGLAWHITNQWAVGIEGRYLGTTNPSFTVAGQTFSYSNNTISALVGIAYKFGPPAPAMAPPPAAAPVPPSFMVFFDWDRANLSAQALNTIKQAANAYKTKGQARVTATGHADRSGPENYNMTLSLRRANAVKDALVKEGVPATAIAVVGRGESMPLVQTADGVREPQNRRVEILVQ
jgi:outer membrane protein OmpA-like peptidoglycan-associated protein